MTAAVLAMHGAASSLEPRAFASRNLVDVDALRQYLASTAPFVPLRDALDGRGTALTIDDATQAGADAARVARELGHAVTLFVNPGQIELGAPYSFLTLNALLDSLDGRTCAFEGEPFTTCNGRARHVLRAAIKRRLRSILDESARLALVETLGREWGVDSLQVPPHFQTLDKNALVALRDAGVDLQNHGWFHSHHGALSPEASAREIADGRAWLRRELSVDAPYFAVPFGDQPPVDGGVRDCDVWFLLTSTLPQGVVATGVVNRETLNLPRRPGAWIRSALSTVVGSASSTRALIRNRCRGRLSSRPGTG